MAKKKAAPKKKSTTKAQAEINSTKAKTSKIIKDTSNKTSKAISNARKSAASKTNAYKNGKAYKNANTLQNSTIDDIAKKYGFDFSQKYANNQAETMAAGQRNIYNSQSRENESMNKMNLDRISNNYDSAAGDLDKGYFQQFLGTQQNQANRGLNAGIAANQNLQLAMNKQGEVADLWKQRNLNTQEESMRYSNTDQTIAEALAQVEKEKGMNSQKIYQDLRRQGYDILSSDRNSATSWANSEWDRTQSDINNMMDFTNMDVDNWNRSADRNISSTLDLSKMSVADIYNEQERADRAADRAASLRAARMSRPSSPGSPGGSYQRTVLSPAAAKQQAVIKKQKQTPVQKYVNTIAPVERWRQTLSPTVGRAVANNSHSIANTPNLTAWDKMRMFR